jgi:glucose/arabinose dehydrogenase/cytochrome c5
MQRPNSFFSLSCFLILLLASKLSADNGGIVLPAGFKATVIADKLGKARSVAIRDNGDIYISLLEDVDLNYICALRDSNGDGTMDVIKYFGELGSMVKIIRIYNGFLYAGSKTQVVRYPLEEGELLPQQMYEVIVTGFPAPRSHASKNLAFDGQGNLYVATGGPSNCCQEVERGIGSPGKMPCDEVEWEAGVWKFEAETPNQTQREDGELIATGVRNSVGFQWDKEKGELYGVSNGRDGLYQQWAQYYTERESAEKPAEEFLLIRKGTNFGWPYVYYDQERETHMVNPEYGGDGKTEAEEGLYDDPILTFPGHWAPVGLQFYHGNQFPEKYQGGAFVAFHGSWNRAPFPQQGYNVVFVPFEGKYPSGGYEVFADGFKGAETLLTPASARYRPTGLAEGPDGSLYISEDNEGRVWKVEYTGEISPSATTSIQAVSPSASPPVTETTSFDSRGLGLYNQYCLACHMVDGSGVPNIQPSLLESERLKNDDDHVIRLILQGSEWIENRQYNNVMTHFSSLSDQDISVLINYSKARFVSSASTVTPEKVAKVRATLGK